ncbi:MAG TPA: aminotransferase class V-fold PLP-dependent enzyme [Candidatus Cloacimonadota bacterium]|nr:aminotransferase class V-fold PLP-dependent enzyme [Candidatus Cloacimonadota bacterium]HPT72879.1 aminotransferase class V-fold PLP-dependent enzyme [Candidatus Cloacimonadota bacterium]
MLNTKKIRKSFPAIRSGRIVTNNAASTQIPIQLIKLLKKLVVYYDNVHRGHSLSSTSITDMFESSYDTIANFIGAPSRKNIVLYRNTTEAINSIMYSLMTDFREGDNVVTTYMEHNSNYVPWYGLVREMLPKFGINVECRLVRFDKETGKLDLDHLKSLVDSHTKIVCCAGASNFLGTKNPIQKVREIANASGYVQPNGDKKSYLLIDGAQLVPHCYTDVRAMDVDFLAWSFHKMLSPFGVGALYAREELLETLKPFLYGGDMIAEGKVTADKVEYNDLPWKYTAGTPNILGTIMAAQTIRLIMDFSLNPGKHVYFEKSTPLDRAIVKKAMDNIDEHEHYLVAEALTILGTVPGLTIYGPKDPASRTALVAFNHENFSPFELSAQLLKQGVESRSGCHCSTLAHYYFELNPPASCRLSFYLYNDLADVRRVCEAVKRLTK